MKFGHEFQEALKRDDFPQHWVQSAIAYGQLKRCIKRVQGELSRLGLDVPTLRQLLQTVENSGSPAHAPFQYSFAGLHSSSMYCGIDHEANGRVQAMETPFTHD